MKESSKAVIRKDIKSIVYDKNILYGMIIAPLIIMILLPAALLFAAKYAPDTINGVNIMRKHLTIMKNLSDSQFIIETGINYMFPILFILIPIMASSMIAGSSFVVEKEKKTLETLLYTPIDLKELFSAKVIGVFIPSYAVSIITFIAFLLVTDIEGWALFGKIMLPNVRWGILLLWLTPVVLLFGIFFMVMVSAKAKSFQEAQQMCGFIVMPVLFLIVGQAFGVIIINNIAMIVSGIVIFAADFFLIKSAARKFVPEKLMK